MEPGFDHYWATILDTATIQDILREALRNTRPHFTLYGDELSNQQSTSVKPEWGRVDILVCSVVSRPGHTRREAGLGPSLACRPPVARNPEADLTI